MIQAFEFQSEPIITIHHFTTGSFYDSTNKRPIVKGTDTETENITRGILYTVYMKKAWLVSLDFWGMYSAWIA